MQRRRNDSLLALAGFALGTVAAAWFGSRYSPRKGSREDRWYRSLDKPIYNPPRSIFPIVWTTLYGLMAWSGWRVWRAEPSPYRSEALLIWTGQLAANAAWSKLFFGDQRPDHALVDVTVMRSLIASYIATAYKVDRPAAIAFVPYLGWVAFATHLNREIVRRNPPHRSLLAA
jgi:translocator protein